MSDGQQEVGRWNRLTISIAVFALALAARLLFLYHVSRAPGFDTPIFDARNYDSIARLMAAGKSVTTQLFWQSTFYPLYLTAVYKFAGSSIVAAKIFQAVLGACTCVLTYLLGERALGRRVGVLSGILAALNGPLLFFDVQILGTGWSAFWSVALILLFLLAADSKRLWLCFALGMCGILSVLTRPTFAPYFAAASLWLAVVFFRGGAGWGWIAGRLAAVAAGFLVIATPIAALSARATGQFTFLPASGGIVLYQGNNPDWAFTVPMRPWSEFRRIRTMAVLNGARGIRAEQQFFYGQVRKYMLSQPVDYCKGMVRKTVRFINSRETAGYEDVYLFGRWSWLLRTLTWKVGGFGFPFGLLLPLAIVGLVFSWRQISIPLLLYIVIYPAFVIFVHVVTRYRIPLIPAMCIPAAAGCFAIAGMIRQRQRRLLAATAGASVGIILLSSLPGPFPVEKKNTEAELYLEMGASRLHWRKPEEAAALCSKALELRPDWIDAQHSLGAALVGQGKGREATGLLMEALQKAPEDSEIHKCLGQALALTGDYAQAVAHFSESLKYQPGNPEVHCQLAAALARQGKLAEAGNQYSKALEIDSESVAAHSGLGTVLAQQGQWARAEEHYRRAVRLRPDDPKRYLRLAAALQKLRKLDDAIAQYKISLQLEPRSLEARSGLVGALMAAGRLDEAEAMVRQALTAAPNQVLLMRLLGLLLISRESWAEAHQCFGQLLKLDPRLWSDHFSYGATLARLGREADAVKAFDKAVRLGKASGAYMKVGVFWSETGRYDRVLEVFRAGVEESPQDLSLSNSLAWVLATCPEAKSRNGAEAVRLAEAVNEKTGKKNPRVLDTLAAAYAEAGQFDQAVATAKQALAAARAAGAEPLAAKIEQRLALYSQKKAYHEPIAQKPK